MILNQPKTFILTGAAGYVAPRHMAAIKAVGGELVAAVDPVDSVGVIDRYFPKCKFYHDISEVEEKADYLVVCSPNYRHVHDSMAGIAAGMDVIVEKPAVIYSEDIDRLQRMAESLGKNVFCILNMRLHHDATLLKAITRLSNGGSHFVDINYHTPRGPWYWKSWKASAAKSGGLLFNIGIHLIDLALWAFGKPIGPSPSFVIEKDRAFGKLFFERASVSIDLCINGRDKQRTFDVSGARFDFTNGFEDLHAESYRRILAGNGFTLEDARPAIELCERLTNDNPA